MKRSVNTLVFIYNSFNDPLFQNLVLRYVKSLSGKVNGSFHIITFEQDQYRINDSTKADIKQDLKASNIYWYPLTFHTGRFLLVKKLWDFVQSLWLVLRIRLKYRTRVIFAFANVAAAIAIVLKKLLRMRMIVYSYEPHSEFMVDLGDWKRSAIKYKVLKYLENLAGRDADYIMTGTKYMVELLTEEGSKAQLYRAPTAVDPREFLFKPEGRQQVRQKYGVENRPVFLYLGKFGGLYYTYEIPMMCSAINRIIPNSFFLVVTSNDHNEIREMYRNYLDSDDFIVTGNLTYDEVKDYISAADIGISGVPPSQSQKFRSPTKVAEYLLCGLPYITTLGVSEDDVVAKQNKVGVVVESFNESVVNDSFILEINRLLDENKDSLRSRCREVGLDYRSMDRIGGYLEEIYSLIGRT